MKLYQHIQIKIFAYFSRLIRELHLILPVTLLIIFATNLLSPKSLFELSKETAQQNPSAASHHLFLAQQLLTTNQFTQAETEARLAANEETLQKIQEVKNQPEDIKGQIRFWQEVIDQFPNYRDAYIKLAILNWKIYRSFEAKRNLEKAFQIDPNNEVLNNLNLRLLSPNE